MLTGGGGGVITSTDTDWLNNNPRHYTRNVVTKIRQNDSNDPAKNVGEFQVSIE
jgi:hypothetical protein